MRENMIDASKLELQESIVNIRRVAKTVKGGRNMRFSVTIVVGDREIAHTQETYGAERVGHGFVCKTLPFCSEQGI